MVEKRPRTSTPPAFGLCAWPALRCGAEDPRPRPRAPRDSPPLLLRAVAHRPSSAGPVSSPAPDDGRSRSDRNSSEPDADAYWRQLMAQVQYLGPVECAKVQAAVDMAYEAHQGQLRKSGEPFVTHPVAVAELLADLQMDAETVIAGLLHDTVEDTAVTFEQIEERFGVAVRKIVEGETKVSKLPHITQPLRSPAAYAAGSPKRADEQAENLRWMFVAMIEDWRIIVVKLADRLHNMRTLQHMPEHKQTKIAAETLEIFAPLAHRLGLWRIKSELENLAFFYLHPEEYRRVEELVNTKLPKYQRILEESRALLEQSLMNDDVMNRSVDVIEVTSRTKELYSVWAKMRQSNRSIHEIYDLVALRVTIDPKEVIPSNLLHGGDENPGDGSPTRQEIMEGTLCYYILGRVHDLFPPYPRRVKDYIAFPKPNGYRSLHTTVFAGEKQALIEVQIRTQSMHKVAEYGRAAHCLYNDKTATDNSWLNSIQKFEDEIGSSREFVETVRQDILGRRVFVFVADSADAGTTRILNLPRGATLIDAAYQMQPDVPELLLCGKVNGSATPLGYELANGDVVSFVCSQYSPGPESQWLEYAKVRSTRTKLKLYFRDRKRKLRLEKGWRIVQEYMQVQQKLFLKDRSDIDGAVMTSLGFESVDEMCSWLARSNPLEQDLLLNHLATRLCEKQMQKRALTVPPSGQSEEPSRIAPVRAVNGDEQPVWAQIASCCHPLPGDRIFGHSLKLQGVPIKVHRDDCVYASRLRASKAGETVELEWAPSRAAETKTFRCWLKVVCDDRNGLLSEVTAELSSLGVFIKATQSASVEGNATLEYCLHLRDAEELLPIVTALLRVPGVKNVERKGSSEVVDGDGLGKNRR